MREAFLGIDLGTSSVKAVLLDDAGRELASLQVRYAVDRPHPGWAEQDPETWWRATSRVVSEILAQEAVVVKAVGLSGQMHGLVLVGQGGRPLRSAIIWSDSRSARQAAEWADAVDPAAVEAIAGFPIATGMLGVSLSWVRQCEPEVYARAHAVMLPKDYIRFRLTGLIATDPTDAGGSLLFDVRAGRQSTLILESTGLRPDLFPPVLPTLSVAGHVGTSAAEETGIPVGTPVATGGGDQAMAAIPLGLRDSSRAAVAISSGGTVFKRTRRPLDPSQGLHVLPHARRDQWLAMGVVLSAGLSLDWLSGRIFGGGTSPERISALMEAAFVVAPGAEGLEFSAQLGGTRTPVVDDAVRGRLVGLGFHHGQEHLTRALVEGVCIELCRSLTNMAIADEPVRELVISGGGARFRVWRQVLSDVAQLPVRVSSDVEHSALGAAFASAEAIGTPLPDDGSSRLGETVYPDPAAADVYRELAEDLCSIDRSLANGRN